MKPTDKAYKDIVTRAFIETSIDGGPGLVEYINKLEKALLGIDRQYRMSIHLSRYGTIRPLYRKRRADVHKIIKENP